MAVGKLIRKFLKMVLCVEPLPIPQDHRSSTAAHRQPLPPGSAGCGPCGVMVKQVVFMKNSGKANEKNAGFLSHEESYGGLMMVNVD